MKHPLGVDSGAAEALPALPEHPNQQHRDLKNRLRCEPPLSTPFSAHTALKVL